MIKYIIKKASAQSWLQISILFLLMFANVAPMLAFSHETILMTQQQIQDLPIGSRIAYWAEQFVGVPYDPDPLGTYVRKKVIEYDSLIDCMYHVFRSVELAFGRTPQESTEIALDKRFKDKGALDENGNVRNYDDRFQYGMDMIQSGKWGEDITVDIGKTINIRGARTIQTVTVLTPHGIREGMSKLQDGDILYFVKAPERRSGDEIVGHLGIIKKQDNLSYLIHASGVKGCNSKTVPTSAASNTVKKISLDSYISHMPFIGIIVTRFSTQSAL
ncbi:MAG: hypothetical protein HQL06_10565 [Nitrospirae bacterium]|nr:hypothetical protein [Nitrospirota bacterium]